VLPFRIIDSHQVRWNNGFELVEVAGAVTLGGGGTPRPITRHPWGGASMIELPRRRDLNRQKFLLSFFVIKNIHYFSKRKYATVAGAISARTT
jgi:hypothetical protein